MKKIYSYIILGSIVTITMCGQTLLAQELLPTKEVSGAVDDLGDLSDRFQELFFEALKQKAITNYDRAIESLEACIEMNPEVPILYIELGKNYFELKEYKKAEESLLKLKGAEAEDRYILALLYETYLKQDKYKEAVTVLEKLVKVDSTFKEQLVNLYYLERRYDNALTILDEVTEELGNDAYRTSLRQKIMLKLSNPGYQISKLQKKIEGGQDSEQQYLNLIYLHSKSGKTEKAYKTALELLQKYPKSELVHLSLYKFYLDDNQIQKAIASIQKVLKSKTADDDSKYKVITDFLIFVKEHPEYEKDLEKLMNQLDKIRIDKTKIFAELGHFYYKKDKKEIALNYYERGIQSNVKDYNLLKRILLLQLDLERFEKAKEGSDLALEMYPANPIFYLINGVALIQLNKAEDAVEILSSGMDYIIDDTKMESDFYLQLGNAYKLSGDTAKAASYKEKAVQLQNKS